MAARNCPIAGLFRQVNLTTTENRPWTTGESVHATSPNRVWTKSSRATSAPAKKLIDRAKKIDPKGVKELAEEVERDKETAERFVEKK
jgi:hypothetical protein